MRISDWSSDVCSSDLSLENADLTAYVGLIELRRDTPGDEERDSRNEWQAEVEPCRQAVGVLQTQGGLRFGRAGAAMACGHRGTVTFLGATMSAMRENPIAWRFRGLPRWPPALHSAGCPPDTLPPPRPQPFLPPTPPG